MDTTEEKERNIVRDLAKRVAELSHSQENAYRQKLWLDVNSLRKPERPPVICHPGGGAWEELADFDSKIGIRNFLQEVGL